MRFTLYIITFCISLVYMSCTIGVADGGNTSDIGNAKIAGTIVDQTGSPVVYALVSLNSKSDTLISIFEDNDPPISYDTSVFTNDKGAYSFNLPDTGMYYITVAKDEKFLTFIDSIHITDTQSITLATDTLQAPGSVTGIVQLDDTTNIGNKEIKISCKEYPEAQTVVVHGERFTLYDLPEGYFHLLFEAQSNEFSLEWRKVGIKTDYTTDVGTIKIKRNLIYLKSSNVMSKELIGLDNVALDITPQYTFSSKPTYAEVKAVTYPEQTVIKTTSGVLDYTVYVKHETPLPSGKEIGIYLDIKFVDGEQMLFDFTSNEEMRFTTEIK